MNVSQVLSLGLWPALPLTGYWAFLRPWRAASRPPCPAISLAALAATAGLAIWSFPLLIAAIMGVYSAEHFGGIGWIVTLVSLVVLFSRQGWVKPHNFSLSVWDCLLGCGLLAAAALYVALPTEILSADHDEGIYVNHAVYIARHGQLDIPFPWPEWLDTGFRGALGRFRGTWPTDDSLTVVFGHLYPVWLAQAFETAGQWGLYRLNPVLSILSLSIFYGLVRSLVSKPYAVVGTLFLAFNVSQLWVSRITLSEVLTQLFVGAGLLLLMRGLRDNDRLEARWSGVFLGLALAVRIDSLILVPLLLLAHVAMTVLDTRTESVGGAWRAFYQTAVPIFALALLYYPLFSKPYWDQHDFLLAPVGALAAFLLLTLLVASRFGRLVRPMIVSTPVLAVGGLMLFGAVGYAYFIRPHNAPYDTFDLPGLGLDGKRSYAEDSVVNLARYVSPLVVWAATLGWFVSTWLAARKGRVLAVLVALALVGGYSAIYLWKPSITPMHFWAIRRFVPVTIPGFILFATVGISWITAYLPRHGKALLSGLVLGYLCLFTVRTDALIYRFQENQGYSAQFKELADKLPSDRPIVATGQSRWWTPLYLVFDRQVIPLNVRNRQGKRALIRLIAEREQKDRPVLLLADRQLSLPGLRVVKVDTITLSRSYTEWTPRPLPQRIKSDELVISFYEITEAVSGGPGSRPESPEDDGPGR